MRAASALLLGVIAATTMSCGSTASDFPVSVGNRTTFPITVYANGGPIGDIPAGQSGGFDLGSLRPSDQATKTPLGNIVSPTPIVNVIFAARELERGTLSPGQTATLVQHYVTYVEFKPLCPRTTVTVNASGVITTEGPDRWACAETPPIAAFVFSPTNPAPGSPVVFNAAGSQASSGRTIVQYVWDFGDPNSPARGTGPTATHTYGVEGTYNATLTVVDDAGQQGSKSQTVPVKAAAP